MENENPPADPYALCKDEGHNWVWSIGPNGLQIAQCQICPAINWEDLASIVQSKVQGSWQAKLVANLDRCPHGRHEGDTCAGWTGPGPFDGGCYGGWSTGNPNIKQGITFAWGISGTPKYHMPERAQRHDGAAWVRV